MLPLGGVLLALMVLSACAGPSPRMRLHFVNVGQGAATLLEFPCAAVLVDTGGEQNQSFSGNERLLRYLERFFDTRPDLAQRLELLVLTHPHIDHTRGAKLVLERYPPRHVVTNGREQGSGRHGQIAAHRYAEEETRRTKAPRFRPVRAHEIPSGGLSDAVIDPVACDSVDPELRVFWGGLEDARGETNGNNHSVVLHVRFGRSAALFTGDLEVEAIEELLVRERGSAALRADVYHVGHHGSHNGTTAALLDQVQPEFAVISMGPSTREHPWTAWAFGHPSEKVIRLLEASVRGERTAIPVKLGLGAKRFGPAKLGRAIYATGWDGDLVLEAGLDGTWTVVRPYADGTATRLREPREPACQDGGGFSSGLCSSLTSNSRKRMNGS